MSTNRKTADLRYTVMLVPEGGRGKVVQLSVRLATVRRAIAAGATVVTVLVLAAVVQAATFRRVVAHDALVGENLALKARLEQVDHQLAELGDLVQRVRVYDDQLRNLATRDKLPGFGPLDPDEAAAREAWIAGIVPDVGGDPVETDPALRAAALAERAAGLARDLGELAPQLDTFEERLAALDELSGALPQIWPVEGVLTSDFGWRRNPFGRNWKFHTGIDVGAPYGAPIWATSDGLVVRADWFSGHGRTVEIDHGEGILTRYCHASRLLVSVGDEVFAGDEVALVGSSGMSTGPHLHFEIEIEGEKVDPLEYLP
ncbi:MAG: M23 family metallopeptidase [Myxococcota bacterium]